MDLLIEEENRKQQVMRCEWCRRWLGERPELLGAFNPVLLKTSEGAVLQEIPTINAIPLSWYAELAEQPQLVSLLRPELCAKTTQEDDVVIEKDCRVSFYFNDLGQEIRDKRYVGAAAGSWE